MIGVMLHTCVMQLQQVVDEQRAHSRMLSDLTYSGLFLLPLVTFVLLSPATRG